MVKILHISDLHPVSDPSGNNMRTAILRFAEQEFHDLKDGEKLLIITGDLRNYQDKDYNQAQKFLSELFIRMKIDPAKDVFVVPGNHDVYDVGKLKTQRKVYIARIKSDRKALTAEGDFREIAMEILLKSYELYLKFVREMKIYPDCPPDSPDYTLPVRVHDRVWRNKLRILHINTTLIADGSEKTNQMADTLELSEIAAKLKKNTLPLLAIGHNSYQDMTEEQRINDLRSSFSLSKVSAYLCGDRHRTDEEYQDREIRLGPDKDSPVILNIVAPRSSADSNDNYSEFGMLLHDWDETTGEVKYIAERWKRNRPEIYPDPDPSVGGSYHLLGYAPKTSSESGASSAPPKPDKSPAPTPAPFDSNALPMSDATEYEKNLRELFMIYGTTYTEIGQLYHAGIIMLDKLENKNAKAVERATAVTRFKRCLTNTIRTMEDDLDDCRPDKQDRIDRLKCLKEDLNNLEF